MSEIVTPKTSIETIAKQTLDVLRSEGIVQADERYDQAVRLDSVIFRWSCNDEVSILVPDGEHYLSLSFDSEQPDNACAGEILDIDGNILTGVDPENLLGFADYLQSLLWD